MKVLLTIATAFLLTTGLSAQPKKITNEQARKFAGTWRLTCETCSSPLVLELTVDGTCIGGKLNSRPVLGQIEKGSLVFALPESWQAYKDQSLGAGNSKEFYSAVSFVTKVRDDGSLEGYSDVFVRGYGSTAIKRTTWTARRVVVR